MTKVKLYSKLTPGLLIVAIFCSACSVPDISDFTKQSAEMTRGIRTGVKDTETLIKNASERDDLYSDATRTSLKKDLKDYQSGMKPTLGALDALDGYLEALNALSQANKKSGENASGVVTSVSNLVTAVSGLTFASSAVNVATGLITLAEQFRTARDFKKRVTLAAEIVEGVHPSRDANGKPIKDEAGQVVYLRTCTDDAADQIVASSKAVKGLVAPIVATLSVEQSKALKPLTPEKQREQLREWGKLTDGQFATIEREEAKITSFGCGVIDFIKFNIMDLKEINQTVSQSMFRNAQEKNRTVLGFYDSIVSNDRRTQNELETILNYKSLVSLVRESEATGGSAGTIRASKIKLKEHLDNLFIVDGQLKISVNQAIEKCGPNCGEMNKYLDFSLCDACEAKMLAIIDGITKDEFDRSNGYIEPLLETRAGVLDAQDTRYLDDLKRITPAHSDVISELTAMKNNQSQLDALLDSSLSALDTWAKTHANLRVAVNTKKPLTVSDLASKVREIWGIISPEKK